MRTGAWVIATASGSASRAAATRSCTPSRAASVHHTKLSRLPAGPGSPEEQYPWTLMPGLQRRLTRRHQRLEAVGRVAHHAALADAVAADLELRLHEREQVEPRGRAGRHGGQHLGQADERHVDHDQLGRVGKLLLVQVAGVHAFEHGHARILAQPPVELPVGDVHAGDAGSAGLEQAVGEPSGGGAHVEAQATLDLDAEGRQRALELLTAARGVARPCAHLDLDVRRNEHAGLRGDGSLRADPHLAGHHRRSGAAARVEDPALGQQRVESAACFSPA